MSAPDARREFAIAVVKQLRDAGYEALWAGGCVRDQLLGLNPKDYDVATNARPEQVREVFGHKRTLAIGASFGVISVKGNRKQGHIEIATFRQDGGYSDGRRPDSVRYCNAEEDAKRRDFTINGIFYDPIDERVIDYVGGQQDLKERVIRAIGNADDRIAEDKLRMLRGIRFAATYGFELESKTFQAIKNHADWLTAVSGERIAAEVHRMFSHPQRALSAKYLVESELVRKVFDSSQIDFQNLNQSVKLIGLVKSRQFATALAAFLLPISQYNLDDKQQEKELRSTLHDWKYSNDESQQVVWLLQSCSTLLSATELSWPQVQRKLVHPQGTELLSLAEAFSVLNDDRYVSALEFCRQKLELPPEELNPDPLVSGADLIQAGFQPGPIFSKALEQIRDWQLLGRISTRGEAITEAARIFAEAKRR